MSEVQEFHKTIKLGFGVRSDLAVLPLPQPVFTRICSKCRQELYTDTDWKEDFTVVCNVCASQVAVQADDKSNTTVVWDLPTDLLGRVITEAEEQGVQPQAAIIAWIEKRAGRPLETIRFYNRLDGKIYRLR
jgi:hypothetical protein